MILLLNRKTRNNSQEDKNGPGVIDIVEVIYQMNGRDRGGGGGGWGRQWIQERIKRKRIGF